MERWGRDGGKERREGDVVVSDCFVDNRDWRGRGGWEGDCEELPEVEGGEVTVKKCQSCNQVVCVVDLVKEEGKR
jgi:hypothetical protein